MIRVLVLLALLATPAAADDNYAADDEYVDDYDPLRALHRSFLSGQGRGCLDHLGVLRARGVPDSTTIRFFRARGLPNGEVPLSTLRILCEERVREQATSEAAHLVERAIKFPWVWAEHCIDLWPYALAGGANMNHRVYWPRVGTRRGWIVVQGTLGELYERHCENAYTPRRRNE